MLTQGVCLFRTLGNSRREAKKNMLFQKAIMCNQKMNVY